MRSFSILSSLLLLGLQPCALYAQGTPTPEERKEARENAKRDKDKERLMNSGTKFRIDKELEAFEAACQEMQSVVDEKSAKEAARKIRLKFNSINQRDAKIVPQEDLVRLAYAQNRLADLMLKHEKQDYFVSSGLQNVWTLAMDPSSRDSRLRRN